MKQLNEKRLHCLLIDDRLEEHEIFAIALEQTGLSAFCEYEKGADIALEKLLAAQEPLPHIIFLDANMPRMDGKTFLEKIKQEDHLKHIPVHMYSIGEYKPDIETLLANGAASYIIKPQSINTLTELLKEVLGGRMGA